jgi:predicted AAA+ superfamily ATPase
VNSTSGIVPRRVEPVIEQAMGRNPVVLLEGPRAVGKSTLLHVIADQRNGRVLDLDSEVVREAVRQDPELELDQTGLVCVDEYQKAPETLQAMKFLLGGAETPGRFLLAGSTRHAALPTGSQALTGRLNRRIIWPLAQSEIDGTAPDILAGLFQEPAAVVDASRHRDGSSRHEYAARLVRGGFPIALRREEGEARDEWFDDYVALTLDRDARELRKVRHAAMLPTLLGLLAPRTAQVVNIARLASELGLPQPTTREYTMLLANAFLIRIIRPWNKVMTPRTFTKPKAFIVDSGVAASLLGASDTSALGDPQSPLSSQFGHLLETFVMGEVAKEVAWTPGLTLGGYWRTYDGAEVDIVLQNRRHQVVAIEVKAGRRSQPADFAGLKALREATGEQFLAGVLLNTAAHGRPVEDRIYELPIDALWRAD